MRLSVGTGDGAFLWPKECKTIEDVPHDLAAAISHATMVVHWQKHISNEDMPPQWMWPFADELEEWFNAVEEKRKEASGSGGEKDDESVPMMQNELAKGRFGR